jgi:hypothetical protein
MAIDAEIESGLPGEPVRESSNYRPGEPLRRWVDNTPVVEHDLNLILKHARAREAVERFLRESEVAEGDVVTFGRLNSICVGQWYEPLVDLSRDEPRISPDVAEFLRRTLDKR